MKPTRSLWVPVIVMAVCSQFVAGASIFYIAAPPVGSDTNPGTQAEPFATIQKGIDTAQEDDTVVVAEGTYEENIRFGGKNIVLRSTEPGNWQVVTNTVIDGLWRDGVVLFAGTETAACVLSGFTLTHGVATTEGRDSGAGICGGTSTLHTRASIHNNLLIGNWAAYGGGIAFCDGNILTNIVVNNGAYPDGGGLYDCDGSIAGNVISNNSGPEDGDGGGLYGCDGVIEANIIEGNRMYDGGGLAYCNGTIRFNRIIGNIGEYGAGALYDCDGLIQNNLIFDNGGWEAGGLEECGGQILNNTIAGNVGLGLLSCTGDVRNCIIWGNRTPTGQQVQSSSLPAYCCIENWSGGGQGNLNAYPHFFDTGRTNFHLRSWSPCLDAGDPASPFLLEPEPNGSRIDLGVYGNTAETTSRCLDTDSDGLPDGWELFWFPNLAQDGQDDPDGDLFPNLTEYRYGRDPTDPTGKAARNMTKRIAHFAIQSALAEASNGDEIVVTPGVYDENISFSGKNLVLRSINPSDSDVVANTIIQAVDRSPVVTFAGTETEACRLAGFTLRGGFAENGAGILGGTASLRTHAAIINNVLTNNSAQNQGGGLAFCDGLVCSNQFIQNWAGCGGGIAACAGTIGDNLFTENGAQAGGGLAECSGVIERNTIYMNYAWDGNGGGLYNCSGRIESNRILDNSARTGGGLDLCNGEIKGNIIARNSASENGGGLGTCEGAIVNNTIAENSADLNGGGVYACSNTIVNCIIWGNTASNAPAVSDSSIPAYSCIQDWNGGGTGNLSLEPYFAGPTSYDFHLRSWSPCIDAGDPGSPYDQEPEPNGGRIDLGAYGNTAQATPKSPDADKDNLPDHWELTWFGNLDYSGDSDPDQDHLRNSEEYVQGTNPLSPAGNRVHNVTRDTGFVKITSALLAASEGDELVVYPGVYKENLHFDGKNVVLRGSAPSDSNIVAQTIIDGGGCGSVVLLSGAENTNCVLAGLTLRNGLAQYGGAVCGGEPTNHTRATVRDSVLVACHATAGGGGGIAFCDGAILNNRIVTNIGSGVYDCDGTIRGNLVSGHQPIRIDDDAGRGLLNCDGLVESNTICANMGVALSRCMATIQGNTIVGNRRGGLMQCGGLIQNNLVAENHADRGGGFFFCDGVIQNNLILSNSAASTGGGLVACRGTIQNNTIVGNSSRQEGGGVDGCPTPIRNCIIWGNSAPTNSQLSRGSIPVSSCVQDWTGPGEANFTNAPGFVDESAGNYRLAAGSPCIDRGQDYYWTAWPQRDLDGHCRRAGERSDLGCFEYGATLDTDGDLLADLDEALLIGTHPFLPDSDGDGLCDGLELLRGSNPLERTGPRLVLVPSQVASLQAALCFAVNGDEIVVGPGTYAGNLQFGGPDVILRSSEPANAATVAATILDAKGNGTVLCFAGEETTNSILEGFTIRGGNSYYGGGVRGNGTRATIRQSIIRDNRAWYGGGLNECNGLVEQNVVTNNYARENGGGLCRCDGLIRSNTVAFNTTWENGGGLADCLGTIEFNQVLQNLGSEGGGGLSECNGVIRNNVIAGNTVEEGPGGGLSWCLGPIQGNLIANNHSGYGGGLAGCQNRIENNTIVGNSAEALAFCTNTIINCIIWGNWGAPSQFWECSVPSYSCIQNWTGGGIGNTAQDPRFVNPAYADYRLMPSSVCIDAGDSSLANLAATDVFGRPRILYGGRALAVDIGAIEHWPMTCARGPQAGQISLCWGSLAGKRYTISWSPDLVAWQTAVALLPAAGNLATCWTDDGSLTGSPPDSAPARFYRCVESP